MSSAEVAYWCEWAVVGEPGAGSVRADVLVQVTGGVVTGVHPGTSRPLDRSATVLEGITLPGLCNSHSHVFHRALRGRVHGPAGDFWQWRDTMYELAQRLDPDSLFALARATYAEMALAGITTVGEFHYLHHQPGGRPYASPGAMGEAVVSAAAEAGLRITLLDTCYLQGGVGRPLSQAQLRFGDDDVAGWAARVDAITLAGQARLGVAVHSVRALRPEAIAEVARYGARRDLPLHVHLSEQPAENEACLAAYGRTPTELLAEAGALGPRTTAVHATHLTAGDLELLGSSGTTVCLCPTTERDLADGIGPASSMEGVGCGLCLGSDSHAVIDLFEEARAVELDERLIAGRRGIHSSARLLAAATSGGSRSLGWPEGGRIETGALADLVTVSLATPRTAGAARDRLIDVVVYAATGSDVTDVVVAGRHLVAVGRHVEIDDVGGALDQAIAKLVEG